MSKKFDIIFVGSLSFFVVSGFLSLLIVTRTTSIDSLLQFLALSIILIIFTTRVILPKIGSKRPQLSYFVEFIPLSLFVYLLVFSTGGLASPFLILTHLFAIGMAFLITPKVSISYVIITVFFIVANTFSDESARILIEESPFAVFLYILAYIAVMPFSQYIAKIYAQKEQWVQELSGMLSTSKKQEENLLKNIADGVILLSRDLKISHINSAFSKKTGYSQSEVLDKAISEVFKFKDSVGNNMLPENIPFSAVLTTKNEIELENLQMSAKDGSFSRINLKVSPVIETTGNVLGLFLIIKDYSEKDVELGSYYDSVAAKFSKAEKVQLEKIARDLMLLLSLEGGVKGISAFINVTEIIEAEIYNLEGEAKKRGVRLTSPAIEKTPLMPKEPVLAPQKKGAFVPIFIFANQNLLTRGVQYILMVAIMLASKNSAVYVDVTSTEDVVKMTVNTETQIPQKELDFLFQKFFNEFLKIEGLKDATGLEIVIAESVFEKHGGSLKIEATGKGTLFTGTLIRPELAATPST